MSKNRQKNNEKPDINNIFSLVCPMSLLSISRSNISIVLCANQKLEWKCASRTISMRRHLGFAICDQRLYQAFLSVKGVFWVTIVTNTKVILSTSILKYVMLKYWWNALQKWLLLSTTQWVGIWKCWNKTAACCDLPRRKILWRW